MTLASIWKKIWEACEILNLEHGSIACWYSFVILVYFSISFREEQIYYNGNNFCAFDASFDLKKGFEKLVKILNLEHSSIACWYSFVKKFSTLSFQEEQIYYNGNNFCAFDASFDLKKDLRSLWNSEPRTWFHSLLVFFCHSDLFLYHSERNKFITTAITFAHLTLASIWKKIWEACEILNLEHGSIACWYSFVKKFSTLSFQEEQIYYNGNNFCAFDASFDLKKDLRSLWNSEPRTWFHSLLVYFCQMQFISLSFQEKKIYYNGNNFCAFDASFDLKTDLRSL